MTNELHITNGDSAAGLLREAGMAGDILPWRDVLHEGPVPIGLDHEALSRMRADFIADRGWASRDEVLADFVHRNDMLSGWHNYRRIRLWFEHDLYDQLQILQVLDRFSGDPDIIGRLSMVCTNQYLGHCTPAELAGLAQYEAPITGDELALAQRAWAAFRAPDPLAWQALLNEDTSALPFLAAAIERFIAEFPDAETGLGLTERRILGLLEEGPKTLGELFTASQREEDAMYLGDWSFLVLLQEMLQAEPPLLHAEVNSETPSVPDWQDPLHPKARLSLSEAGLQRLSGVGGNRAPHWPIRWFGGVCMHPVEHWTRDTEGNLVHMVGESGPDPEPVTIRAFREDDVAALRACAHAAHARYLPRLGKPSAPMLVDYAHPEPGGEVHVTESAGGRIIGFLAIVPGDGHLRLDNIALHPSAQGFGIGGQLMNLAEARAAALGFSSVELYTNDAMTENHAFYRRRGYHELRRVTEQGYDRVYFAKSIG